MYILIILKTQNNIVNWMIEQCKFRIFHFIHSAEIVEYTDNISKEG